MKKDAPTCPDCGQPMKPARAGHHNTKYTCENEACEVITVKTFRQRILKTTRKTQART